METSSFIYNQENLPLGPLKAIKKTLAVVLSRFILLVVFLPFIAVASSLWYRFNSIIMIVLAVALAIIAAIYIYEYYYYKLYRYEFREDGADITKGVITRATGHVRYERLQNIYVDQDVLDRIFGLYDVHYETAGAESGAYAHVDGLIKANADKLTDFLNERAKGEPMATAPRFTPTDSAPAAKTIIQDNSSISSANYKVRKAAIWTRTIMGTIGLPIIFALLDLIFSRRSAVLIVSFDPQVIVGIVVASFIASYVFSYVWYKNFYFNFQSDKGEIRSKVISANNSYLYYDRIQNIDIKQGILERIFGIYSIMIETAGTGATYAGSKYRRPGVMLYGYNREDAEKIRDFLIYKAKTYRGGGL